MADQRPTVQRMRLGATLGRLRIGKEIRQEVAAEPLGCDTSKISRIENGRSGLKVAELEKLLDLYEVTGPERGEMLATARSARQRVRHRLYGDALPGWFRRYLDLETEATEIRSYEGELIPGLLQHEDYARALARAAMFGVGDDEVDHRVQLRMARKRILHRTAPTPPRVCCVIGEAAFRRPAGGHGVMHSQIQHLLELTTEPTTITVQVLPFDLGEHASLGVSFHLLSMNTSAPEVAFLDALAGGTYLEPSGVTSLVEVFDRLRATARGFEETREFLNGLLKEQ